LNRHPVVELLEARRASGSTVTERSDGATLGLAVEGGGMRGIVSAGMLIALDDLGYTSCIDKVFASSAGGINSAFFLQGERWHALSLYYSCLSTKKFIDIGRPWRGKAVVDLRYVLEHVLKVELPISLERMRASGIELHVAITDVEAACLRMVSDFSSSEDLADALVAGSWLPMLAGSPFRFHGYRALDGCLLLEHPTRAAIEGGCTHVLVLSTRYPRSRVRLEPWRHVLRYYLRLLNPSLADAFWQHVSSSMNFRPDLAQGNADLSQGPAVLTVGPAKEWASVSRLEQRLEPLLNAAKEGYESLTEAVTGTRPSTVFAVVSDPRPAS
jgi:predicted patatin/cPLA2 family phospholipase